MVTTVLLDARSQQVSLTLGFRIAIRVSGDLLAILRSWFG